MRFYNLTDNHEVIEVPEDQCNGPIRGICWDEDTRWTVSTIFLSTDHDYSRYHNKDYDHSKPLIFETAVREDGDWTEQERAQTYPEAVSIHQGLVAVMRARYPATPEPKQPLLLPFSSKRKIRTD